MVRVGVLGTGGMGRAHARHYAKMSDVQLFAHDRTAARSDEYCREFGCTPCASRGELLASVEIADVCLPTDMHLEAGLQALEAGCAVFMEKPMCSTVAECREMIEASHRAGRALMPGQVVRWFPEFKAAHEAVASGAVGKPAAARTRRGGRAPAGSDGWFQDVSRSGGVILDLAVHDFDWLRWTLGEVEEVCARSTRIGGAQNAETPGDYALITLRHAGGAVSHVEATWMDPSGFRVAFEVCGSDGMIEYDSRGVASLRQHTAEGSAAMNLYAGADDPYYCELRAFIEAVASGTEPPVSGEDGAQAVAIARAALESARTGATIAPEQI